MQMLLEKNAINAVKVWFEMISMNKPYTVYDLYLIYKRSLLHQVYWISKLLR